MNADFVAMVRFRGAFAILELSLYTYVSGTGAIVAFGLVNVIPI